MYDEYFGGVIWLCCDVLRGKSTHVRCSLIKINLKQCHQKPEFLFAATAEAAGVLSECTEQSRTVILVPTYSEGCLGSGLLGVNHLALMKQKSHLVLIRTESTPFPMLEEIQLPVNAGHCVTWKGTSSK